MVDFAKLREKATHDRSIASVDFETRSACDLLKSGVYRYAEDDSTEVLCMSWAFGDEEPATWWQGEPFPERLAAHIAAGGEMRAWNAQFERVMWKYVAIPNYGFPIVRDDQWYCTAAEAAAMSLPRRLEQAALVCKLGVQKDAKGARVMKKMCKPKSRNLDGTFEWFDTPELREILGSYCEQDVRTERGMYKATRRLTPKEREVFLLDQRMNDHGIRLDVPLVQAAQRIVTRVTEEASATLKELSGGVISGPTKVAAMKEWLAVQHDMGVPSLAKKAIASLLEGELVPEAREMIRLRAEAGKESVKKLIAMNKVVCADEMLRGLLLYHGAGTGRWAGKLVQPHNMPRGTIKQIEQYIPLVLAGDFDALDLMYAPLEVVSSMLRMTLTARPGYDLLCSDFAGIECRGVNWLAGQDDILDLFRQGDRLPASDKAGKMALDPYRHMAVKMGRGATPQEVTDKNRQAGKAAELGCGFQMGPDKFVTAAWDVYQVRVTLEESKIAVKAYRESHQMVKQLWDDANQAVIGAVSAPGSVCTFGRNGCVKVTFRGAYLYIILPIGRPLVYAAPSVVSRELPWSTEEKRQYGPAVQFYGVHPKIRQWVPMYLYGGLIVENCVQALARDLMAEGMLALDKKGYTPILSVHDEVVAEVQKDFGSLEEYDTILRTAPPWAKDFPIMTEGWRGERYRK